MSASGSFRITKLEDYQARAEEPFDDVLIQLASEALSEARTTLMMNYRFLDTALWHVPFKCMHLREALATDGRIIAFDPAHVIARYTENPLTLSRDLLHVLLHCIFRHPFDTKHQNTPAWRAACDIAIEAIAVEMAGERLFCTNDDVKRTVSAAWLAQLGALTPAKIYRIFNENDYEALAAIKKKANMEPAAMVQLFVRDSHELWPEWVDDAQQQQPNPDIDDEIEGKQLGDDDDTESSGTDSQSDDASGSKDNRMKADDSETPSGELENENSEKDPDSTLQYVKEEESDEEESWEEIAKRIEMELQTFAESIGDTAGSLLVNLAVANQPTIDYRDFLRNFATFGEDLRINDDEFDYVYYTYGLSLYENMPLVEPLEYVESDRIREFAIAIDTSGSCAGELVEKFVTRTYEILKESEQFGDDVNIHIIQCDAHIQSDTQIHSVKELEKYRESFTIQGYGGTDFRPVFEYIDQLIEEEEFTNLRGLIYFTDGMGRFPERGPDYDTAFVFVNDNGEQRYVPPWAMKVVLDSEKLAML